MPTLEQDCNDAVGRLRAALIGLYDSVGADPASPQDVARTFRINKTLTWNMAKLMQAGDGLAAVPHVPGNSSIERFLKATESHGASKKVVEAVRDATKEFERVISVHVGDRATLDLVIDGMASGDGAGLRARQSALVLAYIGYQLNDDAVTKEGLDRLELETEDRLAALLRLIWLDNQPVGEALEDTPQIEGGTGDE